MDPVRRSRDEFRWEQALTNLNDSDRVAVFNRTILNVMNNYIPHETVINNQLQGSIIIQ